MGNLGMSTKKSGSDALSQLMKKLTREGRYSISVLTDQDGFPLASATIDGTDPNMQSAVVAQVKKITNQVGRQLGMADMEEIILHDERGQRLICRPFVIKKQPLILTVTISNKEQSYRRATNNAIAEIRRIWTMYCE